MVAAGGIAAGVAELGLATVWLLGAGLVLVVAGIALSLPQPSVQVRDLASGERLDVELDDGASAQDSPTLQSEDR